MTEVAAATARRTARAVAARIGAALAATALAVAAAVLPAPTAARADRVRDLSWHLTELRVAEAHGITQGEGITVAVIDSGVDATHPDLTGNVLPGVDVLDPNNRDRGQRDMNGHGTAIASLIAGHGHGAGGRDGVLGIAPKARILPLNVYDPDSKQYVGAALPGAIQLAVDRGADVICIALISGFQRETEARVRYATERDVLVVAGVGNSPDVLVQHPANVLEAVAVTALDRAGQPATTVKGIPDFEIDIAAPGEDIPAAAPGGRYESATGTSNSTALVAGAVALIRARYPDADREEQLRRLVWTTTEAGTPGRDFVYGWGNLNLVDALTVEPRDPAGPSASPTQAAGAQAVPVAPPRSSDTAERGLLFIAVGVALCLALAGFGVVLLMRSRRRGAATGQATD